MKAVVNGNDALLVFIEVVISVDKLTRQYTIKETSDAPSFSIGDSVFIFDEDDELLVTGDIEYTGIEDERKFVYAGRNDARLIVDNYAEETTQFSSSQDMGSILSILAEPMGVEVSGTGAMPKDSFTTVLIGDNLGDKFMSIAKSSGVILTSDAVGDIHIESEGSPREEELVYGKNIRNRTYRYNSTLEYDRYKVVAQSNFLRSETQLSNVSGEYGSGLFTKVVRSSENLTAEECENLAKKLFNTDRRKALFYQIEVDRSLDLKINETYSVLDDVVGINERLRVKDLKITIDISTDKVVATLERVVL